MITKIIDNELDQAPKVGPQYQTRLDEMSEEINKAFNQYKIIDKDTIVPGSNEISGKILKETIICGSIELTISQDEKGKNVYFKGKDSPKELFSGYDNIEIRNSGGSNHNGYTYLQLEKKGKKMRSIAFFDKESNTCTYTSSPKEDLLIEHFGTAGKGGSSIGGMKEIGDDYYFIERTNGKILLLNKNGVLEPNDHIIGNLLKNNIKKHPKYFGNINRGVLRIATDDNKKDILGELKQILFHNNNEEKLVRNLILSLEGCVISNELFDWIFSEDFLLNDEVLNRLTSNINDYVILFAYFGKYIKDKNELNQKAKRITTHIKNKTGHELIFTSNESVSHEKIEEKILETKVSDGDIVVIPRKGKIGSIPYGGSDIKHIAKELEGKQCIIEFSGANTICSIISVSDTNVKLENNGYSYGKKEIKEIKDKIKDFLSATANNENRPLLKIFLDNKVNNIENENDINVIDLYKTIIKIQKLEAFVKEIKNKQIPKTFKLFKKENEPLMTKYYNLYIVFLESSNLLYRGKEVNSFIDYESFSLDCWLSVNQFENHEKIEKLQKNRASEIISRLPGDLKYKLGEDKLPFFTRGQNNSSNKLDLFLLDLKKETTNGKDQKALDSKIKQVFYIGGIYDILSEIKKSTSLGYGEISSKIGSFPNYAPILPRYSQGHIREKIASLYENPNEKYILNEISFNEIKEILTEYILLPENERKVKYQDKVNSENVDFAMEMAVFIGDILSFSKNILE